MFGLRNPRLFVRWFFTVVNAPPFCDTWIDTCVAGPPLSRRCGRTSP